MNNKILKKLNASNVTYQPLYVNYHEVGALFELNCGLIHLLATFHGLANEDSHKHFREFYVMHSTMKPDGISKEHVK